MERVNNYDEEPNLAADLLQAIEKLKHEQPKPIPRKVLYPALGRHMLFYLKFAVVLLIPTLFLRLYLDYPFPDEHLDSWGDYVELAGPALFYYGMGPLIGNLIVGCCYYGMVWVFLIYQNILAPYVQHNEVYESLFYKVRKWYLTAFAVGCFLLTFWNIAIAYIASAIIVSVILHVVYEFEVQRMGLSHVLKIISGVLDKFN